MLTIEHNTDRMVRAVKAYAVQTGKNALGVLAEKTNWITLNLIDSFSKIKADKSKPQEYAESSHWKLGKLSPKAIELAGKAMGGNKSIWASVIEPNAKRQHRQLKLIRVGKTGRRVSGKSNRLANSTEQEAMRNKNDVRLNARAVGNFFEVMLRRRGSGYLAQSWKNPKYDKRNLVTALQSGGKYQVENINPHAENKRLGSVQGMVNGTYKYEVDLISNAPGMAKYRHLVSRAVLREAINTENWIAKKQAEAAQQMRGVA